MKGRKKYYQYMIKLKRHKEIKKNELRYHCITCDRLIKKGEQISSLDECGQSLQECGLCHKNRIDHINRNWLNYNSAILPHNPKRSNQGGMNQLTRREINS